MNMQYNNDKLINANEYELYNIICYIKRLIFSNAPCH